MKLFLLRRLYGVAEIVDGLVRLVSPFNTGLPLVVARSIARERGRRGRWGSRL